MERYVGRNGHPRVPHSFTTDDGYNLGSWVRSQRGTYRRGKLNTERVARLKALSGWVWNAKTPATRTG